MRLARAADNPAPTLHIQKVLPQGDVEAPIHAGYREPHAPSSYLVKDLNGRVTQDCAWIAAVEQNASDATVDHIGEVLIERRSIFRRQR